MLYVLVSTMVILMWVSIIRKEIQRIQMGDIIILVPRKMSNYSQIVLGILFLLISYYRYVSLSSYSNSIVEDKVDSIYVLAVLSIITVSLFTIYQGIRRYQIREDGIWTPQSVVYWSEVHSYEVIDYRKFNEAYEGKDYKLSLKIPHTIWKKTWYSSTEIDIPNDKVMIIQEFLKNKITNEIVDEQ